MRQDIERKRYINKHYNVKQYIDKLEILKLFISQKIDGMIDREIIFDDYFMLYNYNHRSTIERVYH